MLIKYTCKDMGLNCPFSVTGSSIDEVIAKALEHVREKHAGEFNSLRTPSEIASMELALSRSTKVVHD